MAMTEFKESVMKSKQEDSARPRVPPYIGESIMKIAEHLSYRPNFINYTYKEDMICDGIENCLLYIDNFDPEKSKNPFAYFTQIIYYAFLRRIQKEKKHLYTRYKLMGEMEVMNMTSDNQAHDSSDYTPAGKANEWSREHVSVFIETFEETKRRKRNKNKNAMPIDVLLNDE